MKRIFSLILALMAVQMMFAQITVFRVTNTDDSGEGSLRDAVNIVNALKEETTDSFRIVFDFTTNEEHVITLESFIYLEESRVAIDASDCKGTVVLDGVDKSFVGLDFSINLHNITIKALKFRNFKCGIDVNVTRNACIDGCEFESNQYGVDLGDCISEVRNCTFIGNEVGVEVSNPWILESDDDIVNNSVNHIHDNFIGITSIDKENGNEIGIRIGDKNPTYVYDNVICSNQEGIAFWDNGCNCYIRRNYIGVNKRFYAHGNKDAGINIGHNSGPIEIGSKDKSDGNFIGYNKIGIINDKGGVNIYNNYIGVTPDFKSMSNKEAGVSAQNVYSDGNYIGFNGTNGIEIIYYSTIGADYIGGDGEHSFPNEGYGVYFNSERGGTIMKGTHIFNNKKGGFFFEHSGLDYPALPLEYTQCLFGGEQPFAVKRSIDFLTTPVIDKMYSDDQYIYIEGKVTLLDAENENTSYGFALDSIITIELFASDGGTESALTYLGTTDTDEYGNWSYKLERSKSVGKIVANATHQYHCTYTTSISPRRYTSRFSEPYDCFEVLYDLTRLNYYVKTKREGKGDGSSWKNAMDGIDFASVLPLAPDGSTFHVAEGEYNFSELFSEKSVAINNKGVNIIGGYYKEPSNGDMPNAIDYKTRFVANQEDKFILKINGETSSSSLEELINDVNIQGVEFVDIQLSGSYLKNMKVDSCLFYSSSNSSNNLTNTAMLCYYVNKVEIGSCFFDMNHTGRSLYIMTSNNIIIKNSTFTEDFYSYQSIKAEHVSGDVLIGNCTFVNIPCYDFITIYTEGKTYFYNNTVVGNAYAPNGTANIRNGSLDLRNCIMVGNIYAGNYMNSVLNQLLDSHDNLYSSNFNQFTDKDKTINDSDLHEILDGENKEGIFIPNLAYNGGFTPTVALKSDKLSDGKSIRFPRLDDVLTDQRGVSRLPETCMGAYEIECGDDTTMVTDTIVVGSKFADGKVYDKVGIYADILTKHISKLDCDSVVNHTLFVVPDPKIKEYYVKTSKKGKGDGSSWDDAMDPKTFAFVFENLKTEGVTFYIAEGKYYAVYDGWGKETNNKNAHWSSKHGANICGGYDSLSTGNATTTKPNPALYRTIMTGDFKNDDNVKLDGDCGYTFENFSDNMNSSMISMEVHGDVHISGVELTGMTFSHGTSPALIRLNANSGTEYSATIGQCKLSVADKGIEANNIRNLTVDQCEFDYVRNSAVYSNGDCKVTNSTFNHTAGINYYGNNSNLVVENSTFVKNRSDIQLYIYGTELSASAQINNNTFISCEEGSYLSIYDNVSATVSGNIFAGSEINIYKRDGEAKQQTFANNVIACKTFELGESGVEKDNIKVADITALYKILEGTYSESDGIFTPALTYKGAETRTVALLEETLSDGTPVRFPRLENVLTDQRGVSRLEKTCMGAYEIGCDSDTTFSTDTINVGTKIYGQTFTKVGVHDSIFEILKDARGCDSVVMYRVVVKPDPTTFNYYVKMDKEGRGDGSDWDNAMDSTDFATYLPLAPNGATFYVAAGTYKPVYDINGNVSAWPLYNVNSSISIYGGFPADATGKDVPSEPDKYKTVLGHDVNCSFGLFYSDNNDLLSFVLDGVHVNDYCSYVIKMPSVDLTLRNSYFEGNSNFCDVSNEGSLNVVNTEFSKTQSTLFSMYGTKSVYMEDVKFVENIPSSYFYGDGYDVILKSVNATNNNGYYYFIGSKKLLVENSEFIKNSVGSYLLTTSGTVDIQNSLFDQNEGSMLVNSYLDYEDNYINISKSKFSNNTTSSPVVFGAGSPINCTLTESEFSSNNCYDLLCLEGSNNLAINDCEFLSNNCERSNPNWAYDPFMIQISKSVKKVQIERNKFIGNNSPTSLVRCNCDTLDFKDCFLDKNNTDSRELLSFIICTNSQNTEKNVAYVERNTFSNNKCLYLMFLFNNSHDVYLRNNTIVSNECSSEIWYPKYSDVYLENNTIVGNKCKSVSEHDFLYKSMVGNFIFGNQYEKLYRITARDIEGEPLYNVMPLTIDYLSIKVPNSTNIVSEYYIEKLLKELEDYPESDDISNVKDLSVEISSVLEGTYDPATGLFTPVLAYNGGFTPTVALKKDVLPDGTSIRFPRLENVLADQRGVERLDLTCMGAYEIKCSPIITELKDTVVVGDSYTFNEKNLDDVCKKVGSYYFSDTLAGAENCDSIVKLSLAVRPQKNENGYYVKEDGTGDGSDWNNAMSPKDFAEYLPLVYDGETFHIAAGTYKSTYVDPELGRMYNINSSVTLIGGYPDTVTSTSTPSMPDVFVTKLTADVRGNDYTYYYPNSLDYTPYSNVKDNDSILIRVNGAKTLNLFGMTLSGVNSCDRGAVDLADGASLVMDRCFVQDNVASGVYGKGVDVKVTNSVFTHNYSNNGAAFNLADSKLNVQSTAVYENRAKVEECESEYAMGGVANLENTEATFENSTLSNNAADMGSVFSVKSSKLDLTNNTIVGNQIIPESKHKGSFIGSLDDKSSISLFGNIVIGNQNGEFDGVVNVASSDYNVFSYKTDMSYGSHDMVMNDPKEVQMLLDGDFAFESETVFIPNIQYNGGYTPTVAVIQSAFDGGKILNIPLDDRKVTYDQRGFVRKDSSCIGAFEFPTFMGYYVKKQAHGDGSGRDWENSMDDTTFAKYFPIVPTSASFHVAEGVYTPMFDSYGKLSTSKSRRYSSSRLVNIYGGYPDSAQTGCVADPTKYKTILSVDFNGDDKYVESADEYSCIDALNTSDNGYSILGIVSKVPGWIEIKGIDFRGQRCVPRASSSAVQVSSGNIGGVNTRIEKCSFVGNYAAIYSGCDSTIIEECLFDSLDYSGLSVSSFSSSENNYLFVDKSTFANSLYHLSPYSFKGEMRVQNSTFANTLYGVYTPSGYAVTPENTKVELYNNSFFSGKKEKNGLLIYDFVPVELKGNIISSKKLDVKPDPNGKYETNVIVSDYNVYTTEIDAYPLGENDTIVPQSSIGEIVKGVVENDIFEASLEDEGLYVKKLPTLINVKFEKGGGIKKMPKNATPVTDDQIGEIRPEVDYCVGAIEADCEFKKANFKLELAEEEICRDDTAKVTLTGLTKKEKATYKFAWTSSKDSVYVVDTFGNPGSFHVYARQALVPLQMTITNVCGVDTVLEIMQKVNGVGSVPFDGIEEGEVFCQNESEPVKLTTAVEGAIFTGECVVKKADGYYFDASKAKGDSTRVRCSIQDGDCRSFDEKTIHFFKFDGDEAVEILASTQTKNVCMEKPQAQSVFTVTGWRDGLTCRLNGLASTLMDSTVTKDSVLTVTYGSLKNGEYIFVVSDECKPIASETIKIENEEIDPDMLKLSLDTVVANTQTCDGGEFGDVRVEYSGNINKADVVVVLSSLGTMVKSDTLSEEEAFVVFDNLKPAIYDVKIFFEGMEDCTIGDANYSRTVDVTKPVKFEVAFTATQAICENSIDAMMFTKTSGGNTPYTYKWTKYVGDIATSTVSHTKALHDTLPDLVKNEVYLCDVVDNYGCAASSDTLKIIYDHADSTLVDTFIYDPYQRCKGINNAQMIVDFDVVSEYAHPVYSLKEWNGKEYSEIDKNDADPALNKILLGALAPGKYKLHVGYPSVGCPALIDTTVEIKELVNDFKFEPADSIRMPRCYADNDAAIYFHAIGASRGLTATFSYKSNGKTLYKLSIDSLAGDTAYFVADNLPNDSFVVKMKNVCGEEITYEYNVGAPGFGIEMIDSISFKMLKCRYDSTGIIAFHINTGDYDSTKVTLRYSKPEEVIYVYDDTTYTTVDVPVYKIEPRVKDTIWNADSTDFDVRYERDPETNEIIIDTFVTYEKKDTMIIKKKNKPGIRYVEAVFPCKFDTVYGKDTTFIYSGLPGGGYFIDLVSTIKGCKDSVRIKDTIKIPNPVILSHEVLDISCKSKTDGVISLKPIRSGGRDRTFVLKHDSTFKDGKYEYEMCYIGYLIDGPSTVNGIGQEVKEKVFVNYEYDGCPLMTSLNRISNEAHLYKKDGDSYTQIQRYDIINPDKNLKQFLFGEEWKSIKWTKQDATGNYIDFTIVTPDSTTYEEDVYYSGPDTIKTAVWSYTHLPNFWKDEYGEWLESGVQTIANLSKGVYQCVVTDSNDCVYSTKISVVEPKDPLRIEEVTYDAEGALCDPTKRHIDMKVKGGWGDYNYMVMDGKNEGKGGLIDNYLAATSITYDTLNAMGVYRSQFLDPGKYRVAVVDGKGCRIEFEDEIEVKTNFTVEGSVKDAVCPGEESADATFVIHDAEKKYKYAVKEHIGSCDTPYDCVDDLNFVDCKVNFEGDGKTFTKKITGGGHGFFIYRLDPEKNDTSCGTYVRVSAIDTMKPMTLSKKSISHVTCNGLSNGSIELYVLGGKAPYIVDVNPSWGSEDVDMSKPDLYPTVDPKDTLGKFPRIVIDNLKARDYYFTITDAQKCHQRFGDTATHTAKLTVKEPDALSAEFAASSMCANAGAANDPNYGSVSALDVKGGTSPYLFSVKGGLDTEREFDDGTTEIYHSSIESDEPFIPVAGYKETTFYYTISDANGCELSTSLMFGQDEVKVSRQTDFLATTWSHYGDIIALIDFCGPESTFDSVSYKFSNEKVKLLDKRLYIYDLDNPKRGATPNAKNIVLSYYDTREVPDGFFIDNFNMAKDMTPLLASHINFVMVTDKSDLYTSTSHDANDSLYLKTDVIMSSYFKGCRYQVEINDFLKVAYDNVELYYGGVDRRKNILDIVVTPNPRTEGKPCTVNVYFANNTEDCVLTFYHMDGSEVDRVTIPAGQLKKTKYDYNDAYVYTYNVENERFNNVEVVVISAVTKYDSKGTILLNAGPAGE